MSRKKEEQKSPDSARPTVVPPVSAEALAQNPEAKRTPPEMRAVREAQVTITDEDALERARLESMDLIATKVPELPTVADVLEQVRRGPSASETDVAERFALGDYAGALAAAEMILEKTPAHEEAQRVAAESRRLLTELYESKLGALDRVPVLAIAHEELKWAAIDHRAGFLLSHVDGASSLETILDVSGMPRLDALRILVELLHKRVVMLR